MTAAEDNTEEQNYQERITKAEKQPREAANREKNKSYHSKMKIGPQERRTKRR